MKSSLITPPTSSTIASRNVAAKMTLPPIAYLERLCMFFLLFGTRLTLAVTPPDESPYVVDWLDFTRSRSARFIAEKTCEMICYLWFSTPDIKTNPLQLHATEGFVSFMQKLLETTQVSHSVIVLSLHFIHRLKTKNPCPAQQGSEFRIAVAGLMMANKFLDECVPHIFFSTLRTHRSPATLTPTRRGLKCRELICMRLTGWSASFSSAWTLISTSTSRHTSRGSICSKASFRQRRRTLGNTANHTRLVYPLRLHACPRMLHHRVDRIRDNDMQHTITELVRHHQIHGLPPISNSTAQSQSFPLIPRPCLPPRLSCRLPPSPHPDPPTSVLQRTPFRLPRRLSPLFRPSDPSFRCKFRNSDRLSAQILAGTRTRRWRVFRRSPGCPSVPL